jgi:hypothetical protein
MKKIFFDEIQPLDPAQAEKERQVEPEGFQHCRDGVLHSLSSLTFSEKFQIIKKVDRDILAKVNTYQGTKTVHTLDYMHKIPSRKKDLTQIDRIVLLCRGISMIVERNDYYKKKRKKIIRVVK